MDSFYHGYDTRHWNPLVGCDHGAEKGCLAHCWAAQCVAHWGDQWGIGSDFRPRLVRKWNEKPLHWRKPQIVAAGFMGDIACLHGTEITAIVHIIRTTPQHTYLLLTKDPERLAGKLAGPLPPNAWMGATVRNQEDADRVIPALLRIPAAHYWLSIEPLLGDMNLMNVEWGNGARMNVMEGCGSDPRAMTQSLPNMFGPQLDWVVAGCESGHGARWGRLTMAERAHPGPSTYHDVHGWLRSVRDQCAAAGVPFMTKQAPVWKGGKWAVSSTLADFPPDLRINQRPEGQKGETHV